MRNSGNYIYDYAHLFIIKDISSKPLYWFIVWFGGNYKFVYFGYKRIEIINTHSQVNKKYQSLWTFWNVAVLPYQKFLYYLFYLV